MWRGRALLALRILLSLGVLAFVLSRVDTSGLGSIPLRGALAGAAACLALLVTAQWLSAARWHAAWGPGAPPLPYLFRVYMIGQFFSLFLPTSIGGDAVRAAAAARESRRPWEAVSSAVVDRMLGMAALAMYLLLGVAAAPELTRQLEGTTRVSLPGWVPLAVAAAGLLVLFASRNRLLARMPGLRQGVDVLVRLVRSPGRMLRAIGLALAVQAVYIGSWIAVATGLSLDLPTSFFMFAVPVVSLVAMLPLSISGIGLREGAWLVLTAPFAVEPALAVVLGLIYLFALTGLGLLGGALFAVRGTALHGAERADVEPAIVVQSSLQPG